MTARPRSISLRGLAVFWFMSGRGSGLADGVGSRADVQQVLCAASRGRSGRPGALRLPALCCGLPLLFYTNQRPDYLTMCAVGEHIHRREALGAVAFLGQESEVAGHRLGVAADVDQILLSTLPKAYPNPQFIRNFSAEIESKTLSCFSIL